MKLSISWIFDHIDADWRKVDVTQLMKKFNQSVAEIEGFQEIKINTKLFTLAQIKSKNKKHIVAYSPELKEDIELPVRDDVELEKVYLLKKVNKQYVWAPIEDFCSSRQGLLPAFSVPEHMLAGKWKSEYPTHDYVLDIDNKSINHRPDMWGHRGVAREIAALLDLPFKPLSNFVAKKDIIRYKKKAPAEGSNKIGIEIESKKCDRFAGLYFDSITHTPSPFWMALRLMRIGARPIDALVDITNYVMFDMSQPLHAFDAEKITSQKIVVRNAKKKEKLVLLKDQVIELTPADIVVSDGKTPLALAGIRGGKDSGVSTKTKKVFLESAHFDASTIRKTSARVKVRTEASARFEKSLDPNQNVDGILRFVKLLDDEKIHYIASDILSVGPRMKQPQIKITHHFIESKLGVHLDPDFIINTLKKIDFGVTDDNGYYIISVPTFRATKDVIIKEDIVEEIGRFFGYDNMAYTIPKREMVPFSLKDVNRRREIKKLLAFGCGMREVVNYSFYDEQFLKTLNWQPQNAVTVTNPQSENWQQLVTSLIPHLIKNVVDNKDYADQLYFFEWGRVWKLRSQSKVEEQQIIAGILFDRKNKVDFYDGKALLCKLSSLLGMCLTYEKIDSSSLFFDQYESADLLHNGKKIGTAGKLDAAFLHRVIEGNAFAFELRADYLMNLSLPRAEYKPASKYPAVHRDMSMMVPLNVTVQKIRETISSVDDRISHIRLIDRFEKDEWSDKKSLAFTFTITDETKTLTGDEIESIVTQIIHKIEKLGVTIR